jgi:acyl-CoA synthetase (NDP forming)
MSDCALRVRPIWSRRNWSLEVQRVPSPQPSKRSSFKSPEAILRPRSIAIVGASETALWPKVIHGNLLKAGFPGSVYPVNPRYREIWGVPCYPDVASLPSLVDQALVIVPASAVTKVLEDCTRAGIPAATIYASNIGEGSDPEVIARGAAVRALCERSGITLAGPNCMGSNAVRAKCYLYGSAELHSLEPGSVAFVTQSGGTVLFVCRSAIQRGIRFSYMISSGNEIDLDLADYVNFLVDDEHTRVILLFIEGIRRPEAFMAAATRALAAGKPILAIKTGKSEAAQESAMSHTGAIAGDYAVYAAMCERYGIVNCESLDDLLEACLCFQAGRLPKGGRVAFVTTSGGTVDLLHDYLEDMRGVTAPDFSAPTKHVIRALVTPEVNIRNPLDFGSPTGSADSIAADICKAALNDPQFDMVAWAGTVPMGTRKRDTTNLKSAADAADAAGKPLIGFGRMYYMFGKEGIAFQDEVGIPFLQGLQQTLRALSALSFYGTRAGKAVAPLPPPSGTGDALAGENLKALLAQHGLPSPRSAFAADPQAAATAAARIGFPVVLKIVSPTISHKTEVGGVRLNLGSEADVVHAAEQLAARVAAAAPDATISGFLIQEMVQDGIEVIVGARNDPLYGPMILIGTGGIFVELLKDSALRLLPAGEDDVRAMIAELKLAPLLAGFRGKPAGDVDALVTAVCALSEMFLAHRHLLSDLEINPLLVLPKGRGVCAVDVRMSPFLPEQR